MDYLNFGTASFDLLYRLEHYDTVVLIDGIDAALAPGELKIFGLDKIEHISPGEPISTHEVNLKGLFELCQKLRVKTKIFVAGIQVKDISYGEGLSEELRQRTQETIQEISKFLDQVCGER